MFIKTITIPYKKSGNHYTYYRLCESYRIGDAPRHRNILNLGTLEELSDPIERKLLADRIEQLVYSKPLLFESAVSSSIHKLAEHFAKIIINRKLVDVSSKEALLKKEQSIIEPDFQDININSIEHTLVREVGAEWLCKQTLERLKLAEKLRDCGWKKRWIKLAMIYITARAIFPASDLKTEDWIRRNSALAELYNIEPEKITRHHLYKVSKLLYKEKEKIETFFSKRTNDLFKLDDKIVLYDLTNIYFEGQKKSSRKARFGRSKEKRNDAKLMALALVTNSDGFIKYSEVYEGNMKDSNTLKQTLTNIECRIGNTDSPNKKVVVMDAGIATEENLKMLRESGYDYVCVSLSKIKEYEPAEPQQPTVKLQDKRGSKIEVQWIKTKDNTVDNILYVKSELKKMKEFSMEEQFCKRFEEGLIAIVKGIEKKHGVKKADKVYERIGRLKEKYPSVHRYYHIKVVVRKEKAIKIEWEKKSNGNATQGVYFIRTTLKGKEEKELWNIYNTIREIESTFRVLKTDLKIRPVFHQEDIYSESHMYGSILAYTLVQSIRHPLKAHHIHWDWSNIVRTMNSQKIVTTSMKTRTGKTIYLKKCSIPEADVRKIYQALNYQERPFWQKKSVLPKNEKSSLNPIDSS